MPDEWDSIASSQACQCASEDACHGWQNWNAEGDDEEYHIAALTAGKAVMKGKGKGKCKKGKDNANYAGYDVSFGESMDNTQSDDYNYDCSSWCA